MTSAISEYNADLAQKYAEIDREESPLYWLSSAIHHFSISRLPASRKVAVLDLACGSGEYCRRVAALGYREVVGVDISAAQISECIKRSSPQQHVPHFIQASATDLLRDSRFFKRFDIVNAAWLFSTASDVEQFSQMVRSTAACLKTGGLLTAVDVNFDIRPSKPEEWDQFGISVLDDRPAAYRPSTGDVILGTFDMLGGAKDYRSDKALGVRIAVTFFDKSVYRSQFAQCGLSDLTFHSPSEWRLEQLSSGMTNAELFKRYSRSNPDLIGITATKSEVASIAYSNVSTS